MPGLPGYDIDLESDRHAPEEKRPVDSIVKPLNEKQKNAMSLFSSEWLVAPLGVHISTLMSLRDRGLIEGKMVMAWQICIQLGYKSGAYHWRLKSV